MARPIRVEMEGAVYHVTARGNERRAVFRDDADRRGWLEAVDELAGRFGVVLHAYCLMPNHYHMVVETPRGNLSRAIGWLQTAYSIRFNRRHRRSGHLFQGRFKAHLVEADSHAARLVEYVHLNPVRPRNKRAPIPAERWSGLQRYRWSSHPDYAGLRSKPEVQLSLEWLRYWGGRRPEARAAYRRSVRRWFGGEAVSPLEELRGGLVLGGDRLWDRVRGLLRQKGGQEEVLWNHRQVQEERRRMATALADAQADHRIKVWLRVRLGGERMADVARELGYRSGSATLQIVKRLEARALSDLSLARRLKELERNLCSVKS